MENRSGKVRILVADDDVNLVKAMEAYFEPRFHVFAAHDGLEAIRMYHLILPDVVVMDIAMPKLDGVEATRKIREIYPDARIIVLSAYADKVRDEGISVGALEVLEKPFKLSELESVILKYVTKKPIAFVMQ